MKALILAVGVAWLVAVGCSFGDEATATPSPTSPPQTAAPTVRPPTAEPTPSPSLEPDYSRCPVDAGACAIAQQIVAAYREGDVDALISMTAPLAVSCPVPWPVGLGGPYPLCEDATVDGEPRAGFAWSSGSEGGMVGMESFRRDVVGFVRAALPVATIGCGLSPDGVPDCKRGFDLIFGPTPFGEGDWLVVAQLAVRLSSAGKLGIVGILPVILGECEQNSTHFRCEILLGGPGEIVPYETWGSGQERSASSGVYLRWNAK